MKGRLNGFLWLLLILFNAQISFGQEHTISGTVTDENNVPLPGVNILIEGTTKGTQTDFDGNYSLEVNQGQTLVFSFIGFEEEKRIVDTDAVLNVSLTESSSALDEVVVTAFGRKMTRNETTASVSSVSSEDIQRIPQADARGALVGKLPGVVLQETSGTPGSEPQIRIRGQNSITANNEPLYVIDGMPVNAGNVGAKSVDNGLSASTISVFSLLDPGDIENISILKDAAAVAPYGADAANGVVLVTTKSGQNAKIGEPQFSISSYVGVQNWASKYPDPINADDRLTALEESIWNTFGNEMGNGTITSRDQIRDFYDTNYGDAITYWETVGKGKNYNWKKALRQKNAFLGNVHFSLRNRGENSSLFASVGYNKTEGTMTGTNFQRITGFLNYSADFWDRVHFKVSANVGNVDQDGIKEEGGDSSKFDNPIYMMLAVSSWVPPYNDDGSLNIDGITSQTGKYNTLYTMENDIINTNTTRALQNTQLGIDITDNLKFNTSLGLDFSLVYFKRFANIFHGDGAASHGIDNEISQRLFNYTTQNSLDYSFDLGDDHHFRITALQEYTKYKAKALRGEGENFPIDGLTNLSGTSSAWFANSTFTDQWTMRYVGLLNYNFNYKYVLSGSYSYQGDTRFSEKWGGFYSVGAAWNMEKENLFRNIDFLDRLKFKIGYGVTGNAGIGRNQYQALFGFGAYRGNPATAIDTYGTNATWEKSKRFDVGFETSTFNQRLYGSLNFYANKTTDMLFEVPLPYSGGLRTGSVLQNSGEMTNRGIEFEIGGVPIKTDDFTWTLNWNISTLKNKVTKIPKGADITRETSVVRQGHMVNEWYVPDWAGVDPENGDPLWYVDKTQNDETTNIYSEAKRNFQGTSPLPTYYGSLSTRFQYKNIFLDAAFVYSGGNQIYEYRKQYFKTTEGSDLQPHNATQAVFDNAWYKPGDIAEYPRWDYSSTIVSDAINDSSHFLYDDDYIRLRDITLGYSFNKDWIKKIKLKELTISVRGKNMWTWVKDKKLDWNVEARSDGYTALVVPTVKSVVFNLNIKF